MHARRDGAVARAELRPLAPSDSLESLTALLHRAYSRLGAMGLNYTAVDQTVAVTAQRVASGQCFVAEHEGRLVGTVTVGGAWDVQRVPGARQCPWYLRRDIAHLHQLGVEPGAQGQGIGTALIVACEQWAREQGLGAIALDTAAPASHLRARYARLGYSDADEVQWSGKTYRTVIMVKPLAGAVPGTQDTEHRCALVRALWAHVQARDWAAMRAAFADDVVTLWPVTGERFDGADADRARQRRVPGRLGDRGPGRRCFGGRQGALDRRSTARRAAFLRALAVHFCRHADRAALRTLGGG